MATKAPCVVRRPREHKRPVRLLELLASLLCLFPTFGSTESGADIGHGVIVSHVRHLYTYGSVSGHFLPRDAPVPFDVNCPDLKKYNVSGPTSVSSCDGHSQQETESKSMLNHIKRHPI